MAKLARVKGKVFAGSAQLSDIGQFGSALAGSPTNTQDVATIQALSAYDEGWNSAVITSRNYPPIEEVNGVLKTISYQACYMLQEGIPEYDSGTEYSNTSIVKSVNGARLDFYISLQNNNVGHALSDTSYWAKATLNAGKSIGEIVASAIPLSDSGLHLLDGTLLSGSGIYKEFVNYIASIYSSAFSYFTSEADWQSSVSQYGSCGKFVYDSVNNTVRLPKISNILQGTTNPNALGNLTEAGLPNITGGLRVTEVGGTATLVQSSSGAFTNTGATVGGTGHIEPTTDKFYQDVSFSATRSNEIYGKSSTVQPETIKVLYYIVLTNDQKTAIQVDIDEIATDLNGKADVDFTNVNDSGTSLSAGWAMPSDTYINLTLGANASTYTAVANGWVQITQAFNEATAKMSIAVVGTNNDAICSDSSANSGNTSLNAFIPVLKGQTFKVNYSGTLGSSQWNRFIFIYAQGSESEAS